MGLWNGQPLPAQAPLRKRIRTKLLHRRQCHQSQAHMLCLLVQDPNIVTGRFVYDGRTVYEWEQPTSWSKFVLV